MKKAKAQSISDCVRPGRLKGAGEDDDVGTMEERVRLWLVVVMVVAEVAGVVGGPPVVTQEAL